MVVQELGAQRQVSNDARIVGDGCVDCIFDGAHRAELVDVGAHTAQPLGDDGGIMGVAAVQNGFDAPEKGRGRPCPGYPASRDFHLDAQVAFDAADRIDDHPLGLAAGAAACFLLGGRDINRRHSGSRDSEDGLAVCAVRIHCGSQYYRLIDVPGAAVEVVSASGTHIDIGVSAVSTYRNGHGPTRTRICTQLDLERGSASFRHGQLCPVRYKLEAGRDRVVIDFRHGHLGRGQPLSGQSEGCLAVGRVAVFGCSQGHRSPGVVGTGVEIERRAGDHRDVGISRDTCHRYGNGCRRTGSEPHIECRPSPLRDLDAAFAGLNLHTVARGVVVYRRNGYLGRPDIIAA